jgi:tetratricopeptide (TPR) repeat protein
MLRRGEVIAQLRARRFDQLETLLEASRKAALEDPARELDFEIAFLAFRIGDPGARAHLDAWVAAKPRSWAARLARGRYLSRQAYIARGGGLSRETTEKQFSAMRELLSTARRDIDAALQLEPRLTEAYTLLIDQASSEQADPQVCRDLAAKAFAFAPGNLRIWERLLSCLEPRWGGSRRELQAAIAESQKDARRNPRLLALRGWLDGDQAWSAGIAAGEARESKKEAERKQALELAARLWGQALGYGGHWTYYKGRADNLVRLERYAEACADVTRALELLPEDPELLLDRAACNHGLGRYEQAKNDLLQARELDPGEPRLAGQQKRLIARLENEAQKGYEEGRFAAAIVLYDLWAQIVPESPQPPYLRGRALWKQGDLAAARAAFDRSIELNPDHFDTIRNLDYLLAGQRKFQEIVPYWDRFLERHPDHAGALLERAGTHHHLGNQAAALRDLERSCELGNQEACNLLKRGGG